MILTVVLLLAYGTNGSSGLVPVQASSHPHAVPFKKTCKTVTKKVHGKRKRVKVCRTVTSKPTSTPSPTIEPSIFTFLWGSAVDAQGNIFVADRLAKQVVKLSPSGQILARWPVPSDPNVPGSPEPTGVAVDQQDNLYVLDCRAYRIVKLSPAGTVLAAWDAPNKDTSGQTCGLGGPALDGQGTIYVTDFTNSHVEKFSPSGTLLASFGEECPHLQGQPECASQDQNPPQPIPLGQLNHPFGVALDAEGNIYVNDHRDSRVVKYSPSGQQLAVFGPTLPAPYPSLDLPEGIGVDGAGNIYVHCRNPESLVKLSPSGTPVAEWQVPSDYGVAGDPAADAQGNVYVTISADSPDLSASFPAMIVKLSPSLQVLAMWK
jgi:sugar lactone lactonase YvrE